MSIRMKSKIINEALDSLKKTMRAVEASMLLVYEAERVGNSHANADKLQEMIRHIRSIKMDMRERSETVVIKEKCVGSDCYSLIEDVLLGEYIVEQSNVFEVNNLRFIDHDVAENYFNLITSLKDPNSFSWVQSFCEEYNVSLFISKHNEGRIFFESNKTRTVKVEVDPHAKIIHVWKSHQESMREVEVKAISIAEHLLRYEDNWTVLGANKDILSRQDKTCEVIYLSGVGSKVQVSYCCR